MTDHPDHATTERHCDVAVVGGSAAGLAAALQLTRQRRTVIVVDDGTPRNAPAEHVHGYLGHEAAPPSELTTIGRAEVRAHGGEVLPGRALAVRRHDDGRCVVDLTGGHRLVARRVLLATGLVDELPDIQGLAEQWGHGVIHCPFCHGYEVRDRRVVQVVTHPMGLHPTPLLRHLTDRLTVVLHDPDGIDPAALGALEAAGVPVVQERVRAVGATSDGALSVELAGGTTMGVDAVVVGPRFRARAEALGALGVSATPHISGLGDAVEIDEMGQTAASGVFAAGNVTDPSMQVLQAAAHGSRVAAMIAFSLAEQDLRGGSRASGQQVDWEERYAGVPMWSGNPNGTLVREVEDVAPGRALDVGAGEGADALWLAEKGWEVTACDISANALATLGSHAENRGAAVTLLHADASDLDAFSGNTYDLVSLQYGAITRSPDQRGLDNLLRAVAPGGTLLVVGHDLSSMREPVDPATQTHPFDPDAYVGVEEIAAAVGGHADWKVEAHETRPRPPGATSTHHVADVVLRAVRLS
jgi:thioredoxin reductase/SAM-dependent methyltransferase